MVTGTFGILINRAASIIYRFRNQSAVLCERLAGTYLSIRGCGTAVSATTFLSVKSFSRPFTRRRAGLSHVALATEYSLGVYFEGEAICGLAEST